MNLPGATVTVSQQPRAASRYIVLLTVYGYQFERPDTASYGEPTGSFDNTGSDTKSATGSCQLQMLLPLPSGGGD